MGTYMPRHATAVRLVVLLVRIRDQAKPLSTAAVASFLRISGTQPDNNPELILVEEFTGYICTCVPRSH